MANIIPRETYRTIEYRLHTYELMKIRIKEWEASIHSQDKTSKVPQGKGFYSDPTAMTVIKLLNPPKDIREDMCWVHLIEQARCYFVDCNKSKESLFEVWYGNSHRSIISAMRKIPCSSKTTFYAMKDELVYWIMGRAVQHKLIEFE